MSESTLELIPHEVTYAYVNWNPYWIFVLFGSGTVRPLWHTTELLRGAVMWWSRVSPLTRL